MEGSKYTEEQKEYARRRLDETGGDVPLVSLQTGIPQRTLYRWRKGWRQNPPPLPTDIFGIPRDEFIKSLEAQYEPGEYSELRAELMQHIKKLSKSLSDDPDLAYRRAIALTRLLDKVIKLEELTRIERPQVRIYKYEYKDQTLHNKPPWENGVYRKADDAYDKVILDARREYYASIGLGTDYSSATVSPPSPGAVAIASTSATISSPQLGNSANLNLFLDEDEDEDEPD
jgi:transposase-like protein